MRLLWGCQLETFVFCFHGISVIEDRADRERVLEHCMPL